LAAPKSGLSNSNVELPARSTPLGVTTMNLTEVKLRIVASLFVRAEIPTSVSGCDSRMPYCYTARMSELIDLVNDRGEITTRSISRKYYNRRRGDYPGQYMQIALVLGVNALGHLLVHERSQHKTVGKGKIDKICETIKAGETPEEAAVRGLDEEATLSTSSDRLVLARAGVNEYERYRTLYGVILGDNQEPQVNDPEEVAWVRSIPAEELVAAARDGSMEFVHGFFTDAEIAINALLAHPATPESVRNSLNTTAAVLHDFNQAAA